VDSDVLIEVLRARNAVILSRWQQLSLGDTPVMCSPVSIAEIRHGARDAEAGVISALFEALICVPIDAEIGTRAGNFLRRYRKSHSVELGDALIAATAVAHGLALWTQNRKHYPMKEIAFY